MNVSDELDSCKKRDFSPSLVISIPLILAVLRPCWSCRMLWNKRLRD